MSKVNSPSKPTNTEKRLALINSGRSLFNADITSNVKVSILIAQRTHEGSGDTSPDTLDHSSISALKPGDCLYPMWVSLECVHGNGTGKMIRCRKCKGCRHAWRKKVRYIIGSGCRGHATWFVTLTFAEYPADMDEDVFDWAQDRWHAFLKLAAKEGLDFQYIRVVELQKRGTPHFHLAVNRVRVHSKLVMLTEDVRLIMQSLAARCGFGDQLWVEMARLGGKGVASYLSKYLSKSETWDLARDDGRSIRRYSRSQCWCFMDKRGRVWRWRRVGELSDAEVLEVSVRCVCGLGQVLNQMDQARRWLDRVRAANTWVAPLDVFDWIHSENGIVGECNANESG